MYRRRRHILSIISALGIGALLLGACGGSDDEPTEVSAPTTAADPATGTDGEEEADPTETDTNGSTETVGSINLGLSVTSIAFLPVYVADAQGIYADHGLEVELLNFNGGTEVLRGIVAGTVDIGAGPVTDVLNGLAADQSIEMFWGMNEAAVYELWTSSDITDLADASPGMTFAVSGIGGQSHQVTQYMLESAGVDPESVDYVASGGPAERLAALQSGQVDTAILSQPTSLVAEREGHTRLATIDQYVEAWQNEIFYAAPEYLTENEELVNAFLEAHIESVKYVEDNPDAVIDIAVEYAGYSEEDAAAGIEAGYLGSWPLDGEPAVEGIELFAQFQADSGDVETPYELDDFMNWKFVEAFGGSRPS